ncbi:glutaminase GtaA [Coniella lustricola]|uniref:Glutaminase GtaA n=1 Tax=Coniella lustricola TaxID=2025994 RepID=A0A2T2ZVD0_9PEZI|nr:glutaminase GtaA [Coniella lustricola]
MASVPDIGYVYPLLGRPQDSFGGSRDFSLAYPEYLGATFDASVTNLTYSILPPNATAPVKLTLSFLSPITPSSTLRQSLPASYLTIYVEGAFDVGVYVDVNGEWVTGNRDNDITWSLENANPEPGVSESTGIKSWKVQRRTQQLLTEFADRAEWGTLYFSAPQNTQHQSGVSAVLRKQFSSTGKLANKVDNGFRKIMDEEPVFAFAKTFKLSSPTKSDVKTDSIRFTFALAQDPVVQFAAARGLTYMRPFWATYFPTAEEMIKYHYSDFQHAADLASNYSRQLDIDAYASGSSDYRDIAALSARQVLGATQFSGTPDNPILFLKEISSNGNFQTVDVIFPSFPFFLYTNPRWLAYLLEPLLEHMSSGQYPNKYSMHDLGYHFPNATGHSDGNDEYMPLEECGNMLIMGLALVNAYKYDTQPAFLATRPENEDKALKVRSTSVVDEHGIDRAWSYGQDMEATDLKQAQKWVRKSYKLWKQWTVYLIEEALEPKNQLSTDDFAGWLRLQTNLALKGIIGIRAMSEISDILGETKDAKYYREIADDYIEKWQDFALSRDKLFPKLSYEWFGSWTTIYNLYADSLLCFHVSNSSTAAVIGQGSTQSRRWQSSEQLPLQGGTSSKADTTFVPDYVYKLASDWYFNVMQKYGLPLDSRHLYTKSDWEFFAAAVASKQTRTEILTRVAKWLNETTTDNPFTDLYDTENTGGYPDGIGFRARPVVGGHFAFLALERACGGQAAQALSFLDAASPAKLDVETLMKEDAAHEPSKMLEMEL